MAMTSSSMQALTPGDRTGDGTVDESHAAEEEQPRLRADARRNRDRIMAAATRMFGELGPDVSMEEIARSAGVGVGTLYRRFPDRRTLTLAVVQQSMETLVTRAREARESRATAWDRLVGSLEYTHEVKIALTLAGAALPEAPEPVLLSEPALARLRQELLEHLDGALREAQAEGSVRPDVDTDDIRRMFALLFRDWSSTSSPGSQLSHARVKALVLDGLRCRSGEPLPTSTEPSVTA